MAFDNEHHNLSPRLDGRILIGWREWVSLPELGIKYLKAKVDTGARTSALHAFSVESFMDKGTKRVRFGIHPFQKRSDIEQYCTADIVDERIVSDSGGHREKRIVINTLLVIGTEKRQIEMTLTNRDSMQFRMLLGRTGMGNRFTIEPDKSYLLGKPNFVKP